MSTDTDLPTETVQARYLSSYHWTSDREGFGGYSGIVLDPDGTGFVMMSDRAHLIEGTIFRHEGRIIGVRSTRMDLLDYPDSLLGGRSQRDSEGLARDREGRLYVSLESDNRVIRRDIDGRWSVLPAYAPIDALPPNRGIEAIALDQNETLYALPEVSDGLQTPFPVLRYQASRGWDHPMSITRSNGFLPVGADVGPDGCLYVLERGFGGLGFYSRVRRFDLSGSGVQAGTIMLTTDVRRHDNLEGLTVWQDAQGRLRLTMVSDDNLRFFQKTEIVEYALSN